MTENYLEPQERALLSMLDKLKAAEKRIAELEAALTAIVDEQDQHIGEIRWPPGVELIRKARAALGRPG